MAKMIPAKSAPGGAIEYKGAEWTRRYEENCRKTPGRMTVSGSGWSTVRPRDLLDIVDNVYKGYIVDNDLPV